MHLKLRLDVGVLTCLIDAKHPNCLRNECLLWNPWQCHRILSTFGAAIYRVWTKHRTQTRYWTNVFEKIMPI